MIACGRAQVQKGQAGVYGAQAGTAFDVGKTLADLGWKQSTGIKDANAGAELAKNAASANLWGIFARAGCNF
jgi:hypothetical protein